PSVTAWAAEEQRTMTSQVSSAGAVTNARTLADLAQRFADAAIEKAAELTRGGTGIDEHQVLCERLALMATEARAAQALAEYAEQRAASGHAESLSEGEAFAYAAEVVSKVTSIAEAHPHDFLSHAEIDEPTRQMIREGLDDARVREIGRRVIGARGVNNVELGDDDAAQTRTFTRQFAKAEVLK